ncbi:FtsW/RodA/SpoVE family cell cycle protein [Aminomonas paucivorans]|uniref:FtsW/RodA/SpoVE family cell cycle protein n=1 Tax=Aminomonas paucivorans TaxID=81412 RepID=UPI00332C5BFF
MAFPEPNSYGEGTLSQEGASGIRPDPLIWLIPLFLTGLGVLVITSTTSPLAFANEGTPFSVGLRQFRWLLVGILGLLSAWLVPTRFWLRTSGLWWFCALLLTFATLIPGVGASVGGARRWIRLGGLSIQAGELLFLALTVHLTKILYRDQQDTVRAFVKTLILLSLSSIPLLLQPDLGTTILVFSVCMGLFVEKYGWKLPLLTSFGGLAALIPLILLEPYRLRRISAFLDPWKDPLDTGFQAIQGLIAFNNGGGFGTGLGHGFQKLQYLPAAYTDFLYAALGEELGLLGTLGVLALYGCWTLRLYRLYMRTEDPLRASLFWGLTLTVILPLFINLGGVTKMMPLTGMPLPFLSYGGSSLVTMWFRIGLLLRLCREEPMEVEERTS